MNYQGTIWAPSVKSLRDHTLKSLGDLLDNHARLIHRDSQYSKDHRMLIDLYKEIAEVIHRHIDEAGTILPAPPRKRGGGVEGAKEDK